MQRTTRRIALNDAGEAYLARLRPILSDLDEAAQLAQAQTREMRGAIRIVSNATMALHLLAPLVAEFRIEHPGIALVPQGPTVVAQPTFHTEQTRAAVRQDVARDRQVPVAIANQPER